MFSYDADLCPRVRFLGHIKYKENWIHFTRTVDEYVLYIMAAGDMYIEEDGVKFHLQKNDLLFLEPDKVHKGYQGASCEYYYIHFKHDRMKPVEPKDEQVFMEQMKVKRQQSRNSNCYAEGNVIDSIACLPKTIHMPLTQDCLMLLNDCVERYYDKDEHYKWLVSANLHTYLLHLSQYFLTSYLTKEEHFHQTKSGVTVEMLIRFIHMNYARKLSSELIEEKFEVNFDYLNRMFVKKTGETIFHYITSTRINQAKELIRTTNLPFSEIGYLVGIEDRFYFSKLFKKVTGETPTQFYQNSHEEIRSVNQ